MAMQETNTESGHSPLIELTGAAVRNGGNLVLNDINLSIRPGEFVYLVGKVGSGKTSLIRALIGELPVTAGEARLGPFRLDRLRKRDIPYLRRIIGVIFQDFQLLMDRTVFDNLLFVLRCTGWKQPREMKARAEEVLKLVGLPHKAYKMPHQLSGGEQQRIAIARALLNNPSLILADEPTGNLDQDTAADIMNLLMELHRTRGTAFLMVTHNRSLFKTWPGRIIVCENMTLNEEKTDYGQEIDLSVLETRTEGQDS